MIIIAIRQKITTNPHMDFQFLEINLATKMEMGYGTMVKKDFPTGQSNSGRATSCLMKLILMKTEHIHSVNSMLIIILFAKTSRTVGHKHILRKTMVVIL